MGYINFLNKGSEYQSQDQSIWVEQFYTLLEESPKFKTMEEWLTYNNDLKKTQKKQRQEKMDKGIYLSSFHSSKGLEWDRVIIKSANQGITPLKKVRILRKKDVYFMLL